MGANSEAGRSTRRIKLRGIDGKVAVDRDFAVLVRELNRVGIRTFSCCAGHAPDGSGYVPAYLSINVDPAFCEGIELHGSILSIRWYRPKGKRRARSLLELQGWRGSGHRKS